MENIYKSISAGKLNEVDIPWDAYQEYVYDLVVSSLSNEESNSAKKIKISNNEKKGEIDVVVEIPGRSIAIGGEVIPEKPEYIFIECKRRSETLSFSTVGKVFCYSIVKKPRALYIISPKRLSAQAERYAQELFQCDASSGGGRPLFSNIRFANRTLLELSGHGAVEAESLATVVLDDWSLIKETTFCSETLADSSYHPIDPIPAESHATHRLELSLCGPRNETLEVKVSLHPKIYSESVIAKETLSLSSFGRLTLDVPFNSKAGPFDIGAVCLSWSGGETSWVSLGPLSLEPVNVTAVLGDLREDETTSFARGIVAPNAPRVFSIYGEGGVGKTTFCEGCSAYLKRHHGFETILFTMGGEGVGPFLDRLLRSLVAPMFLGHAASNRESEGNDERSILQAVLGTLGVGLSDDELGTLLTKAKADKLTDPQVTQLTDCLCALVQRVARPRVILLRDCHLMAEREQVALEMLLRQLEDRGWGGLRFLLEHRDQDAPNIKSWERRLGRYSDILGTRMMSLRIAPLSEGDLLEKVGDRLWTPDPLETARILKRQTGGNPLFLEHVFRQFLHEGLFVPIEGKQQVFAIDHFELFARKIQTFPKSLPDFLGHRIRAVCEASPESRDHLIAYLGLAAVDLGAATASHTEGLDEAAIAKALGIKEIEVRKLRLRFFAEGVLKGSARLPPAVFIHDIMGLASARHTHGDPAFLDAAMSYVDSLPGEQQRALEGKQPPHPHKSLVGGRLAVLLEQFGNTGDSAENFFSTAIYLAGRRGSFIEQRLGLEGMLEALRLGGEGTVADIARRMDVFGDLIKNELQQGSQYQAERFIEDARTELRAVQAGSVESSNLHEYMSYELDRNQTVLSMRQADMRKFLGAVDRLADSAYDNNKRHFALTRIMLFAMHSNNPDVAREALRLSLEVLDQWDKPSALASFCSDVGQLFFIENPELTEQLWVLGLDHAQKAWTASSEALDAAERDTIDGAAQTSRRDLEILAGQHGDADRQRNHSRVNLAVALTLTRPGQANLSDLEDLRRELSEKGHTNPLIRLICVIGLIHHIQGRPEEAIDTWEDGLRLARSTSSTLFVWPYHNNLGLAALLKGEREKGITHFRDAIAAARGMIEPSPDVRDALARITDGLRSKMGGRGEPPFEKLGLTPGGIAEPRCTGAISRLVHNVTMLDVMESENGGKGLMPIQKHSYAPELMRHIPAAPVLKVEILGRPLLFSIE